MNILHLMSARKFVGEAARVLDLAEAQREAGHAVAVCVRSGYAVEEEAAGRGLPYIGAAFNSGFKPFPDYSDVRKIREFILSNGTDILHAHRGKDHWLAAFASRGLGGRVGLVRTRHVVTPVKNHFANRWLYCKKTSGVISVSAAVRDALERSLPQPPAAHATIVGGIRPGRVVADGAGAAELRRRLRIPEGAKVLVLLARIAKVKGQEFAVAALPAILERHPGTILVMAYSRWSDYRRTVENMIDSLGVKDSVRWLASLDDISPLLTMCDIGLVTSIGSEGWSRVAVEYMAAGLPVAATAVGSLLEIVGGNGAGEVVPHSDPDSLAGAVDRLLGDAGYYREKKQNALRAAEFYTDIRLAREVLGFYRKIIEGNR